MAYVAVKGGETAIQNAETLLKAWRRGDPQVPELTLDQITQQLSLGVNRVMCEGSLYDPELAALAIKQSWGDLVEAIFLLRAYRTTLPRFYNSQPLDTQQMNLQRRISAIFKDVPGGQALGATYDYVHRLLDFKLMAESEAPVALEAEPNRAAMPHVMELLRQEGLIQSVAEKSVEKLARKSAGESAGESAEKFAENAVEAAQESVEKATEKAVKATQGSVERATEDTVKATEDIEETTGETIKDTPEPAVEEADRQPFDLTRQPLSLPAERDARLQNLSRADEGFLLGMAYSTQRGYGNNHPFAGEIRVGQVEVLIAPEELGFEVAIAEISITEVQMVNQFKGNKVQPPQFTQGYGLTLGYNERKAMSMALVDRALQAKELGEAVANPAQDEEFVLSHSDNVEAQGFVQHLKLPHYIDFQAELNLVRQLRQTGREETVDDTVEPTRAETKNGTRNKTMDEARNENEE
ncbi:MAG: carbon-phosphorus lyase complex subunit PhnI [Oculatellaceae cyanobacterium Prado106]|jgi:alpha-D-ribose 1-methylphosphonate 5-triphosphate synthase subunit PhnI|nr:carbon-phosphorus lyase complex subunit PhnI [Oculatellaceae cyanobacterium Prado106]